MLHLEKSGFENVPGALAAAAALQARLADVAVAFAGFHADAGHVEQRLAELTERLVLELVGGEETNALRHVDQRSRGLGRA